MGLLLVEIVAASGGTLQELVEDLLQEVGPGLLPAQGPAPKPPGLQGTDD